MSKNDMCPVCKTDRYLSPSLKFLINPECYHKICDSCVDRIFSLGPTKCPYANCNKVLRKNKFKTQTFEDLGIERETDLRRKVLSVYNKKEEDFRGDLEGYNKYLEEIEQMVDNLINGVDVEETENKLKQYEVLNKQQISANNTRKDQEYENFIRLQNMEKQFKLEKLRLDKQMKQEEDKMVQLSRMEMIDELQNSSVEANTAIDNMRQSILKKSSARRKQRDDLEKKFLLEKQAMMNDLAAKEANDETTTIPFTPFNGDRELEPRFNLLPTYYDPIYNKLVQEDSIFNASGYKIEKFFARSINEAFTGLDCIIEEEKAF
ncbi:unnamed protein product [Kuraishia capsulata CBS 1993]|uniref:RNA polymerase II transcription factor B subunit 3 n=1 Tax=Kuraishia capsulata CBS 1993 TaxID=1382522 RepID=W6MJC9_9ASCO|nr:uncharacterized protein KUCA_T00000487001 [Kuraishia capsulata CBS 1993]CDK24522.1 unnamed protein product [Kuraishia capsulata CBS 1993]